MERNTQKSDYGTELNKYGVIAFVPGGNSMWPLLKNRGQSVIVEKKNGRLKKYDVALYLRKNGIYVLHRVLEQTDFGYIMCGDSQFTLEKVCEDQVIGVMKGFYDKNKYIQCNDEKYIKRVGRWYSHKFVRKVRLKLFFFRQRVKGKLKRIFSKKVNKNV